MTDLNKIISGAKSIERILTEQFGGSGRGMREKLDSVRYPIPEPLRQRIAYLARVRNRCVHEEGYELDDTEDYVRKCEAVCRELQEAHAIAARVAQQRAVKRGPGMTRGLVVAGGVLVFAAAWWAMQASKPASSEWEPVTLTQHRPSAPVSAPDGRGDEAGSPVPTGALARASGAAAPMSTGTHQGIGNDVLAIESVQFGYAKGDFRDREAKMTVTVRNTSDRTISSARVDGRLYVNGEAEPLVDTAAGNKPLFLSFGERGLAAGERRKETISLFGDDRWNLPDAINAGKRMLVLRVGEVSDGRQQSFGDGAHAWPVVQDGAVAARPREARPTSDRESVRQRFEAGEHVVVSDSRLEVGKVALTLKKDAFGAKEPGIMLTVTNHAGMTLSSVDFHLQLFIKGESTPVIDSDQNAFSKTATLFLGEAGLADGKTATTDLYIDTFHGSKWKAPDVLKAIAGGQAQVVLSLVSLTDGRKNKI